MTDPKQILRNASVIGMQGQELVPMEAALEAIALGVVTGDAGLREAAQGVVNMLSEEEVVFDDQTWAVIDALRAALATEEKS